MAKSDLTSEILKELLEYDASSGVLTWRERGVHWFKDSRLHGAASYAKMWNRKFSGARAFTYVGSHGYFEGAVFNKLQLAHRVIWRMTTGEWPEYIDHIDGDPLNNRLDNLRHVTNALNGGNTKRHRRSTKATPGIRLTPKGRYNVRLGGTHVGNFDTYEQAVKARITAQKAAGYHENHWRE